MLTSRAGPRHILGPMTRLCAGDASRSAGSSGAPLPKLGHPGHGAERPSALAAADAGIGERYCHLHAGSFRRCCGTRARRGRRSMTRHDGRTRRACVGGGPPRPTKIDEPGRAHAWVDLERRRAHPERRSHSHDRRDGGGGRRGFLHRKRGTNAHHGPRSNDPLVRHLPGERHGNALPLRPPVRLAVGSSPAAQVCRGPAKTKCRRLRRALHLPKGHAATAAVTAPIGGRTDMNHAERPPGQRR